MEADPNTHAGFAALTLMESLLIHLLESGHLDEAARDQIYEVAIGAHEEAQRFDTDPGHMRVVRLLRTLHRRSDGIQVVGELPGPDPGASAED